MHRCYVLIIGIIISLNHIVSAFENVDSIDNKQTIINDSVSLNTINLNEVSVTAKSIVIYDDKIIIYPTPSAKKLARNISSLLELTHSGIFTIIDNELTVNGKPVTIAINGQKADNIDQLTFWAKNVIRIEYYKNPSDNSFFGASDVVNLIMTEYSYGGLTRVEVDQDIPNDGDYIVSSKLVYKKTTFNGFGRFQYGTPHDKKFSINEEYNHTWFDGTEYDRISQNKDIDISGSNRTYSFGFNVKTIHNHFTAVHSALLTYDWNNNSQQGNTHFEPQSIVSSLEQKCSRNNSFRYNIKGEYKFIPKKKYALSAEWNVAGGNNKNWNEYSLDYAPLINTDVNENNYDILFKVRWAHHLNNKLSYFLTVSDKYTNFKAKYWGNCVSSQNQSYNLFNSDLNLNWQPKSTLWFNLQPAMALLRTNINNNYIDTQIIPSISFAGNFQVNDKNTIYTSLFYNLRQQGANVLNELIIQQDVLKWLEGTPSLEPIQYYSFDLSHYFVPSNCFNMSYVLGASFSSNQSVISYHPGGKTYNGIIGSYINGLTVESYHCHISSNLSLLNYKLTFSPSVDVQYYRVKKINHQFSVRPQLFTSSQFNDFIVKAYFSAPEKILLNSGNETLHTYWQYSIGAEYAYRDLIFSIEFNNLFSKYNLSKSKYNSPYYDFTKYNYERGRFINFCVTYTFDYGKKVERSININTNIDRTSSIL